VITKHLFSGGICVGCVEGVACLNGLIQGLGGK